MYRSEYPSDPDRHVRFSVKEKQSFLSRVGSSLVSVVVGVVLVVVSAGLLFYNEGRAVQTSQSLEEGLRLVRPLSTSEVAFRENDGHLVYVSGSLRTDKPLLDPELGVSSHSVLLVRKVWMWQWVEERTERKVDRGDHEEVETTYTYWKDWKDSPIPSHSFDRPSNHQNPVSFPISNTEIKADQVYIGNFILSSTLVSRISHHQPLHIDINLVRVPSVLSGKPKHVMDNTVYFSHQPTDPQVGDIKIQWTRAGASSQSKPDQVSIISAQHGNTFRPYKTEAGDDLDLLYMGKLTPQEIFQRESEQNSVLTWALRGMGWLVMMIGFMLITQIINTIVSWIPLVRDLINLGTFLLSLSMATSLSCLVVALGWLRYRPLITFGLVLLAASPTFFNWWYQRKKPKYH